MTTRKRVSRGERWHRQTKMWGISQMVEDVKSRMRFVKKTEEDVSIKCHIFWLKQWWLHLCWASAFNSLMNEHVNTAWWQNMIYRELLCGILSFLHSPFFLSIKKVISTNMAQFPPRHLISPSPFPLFSTFPIRLPQLLSSIHPPYTSIHFAVRSLKYICRKFTRECV